MGLFEILTLIFVVMKLAGIGIVATWSWWLVLAPLLVSLGVYLAVGIFFMLGLLVTYLHAR